MSQFVPEIQIAIYALIQHITLGVTDAGMRSMITFWLRGSLGVLSFLRFLPNGVV